MSKKNIITGECSGIDLNDFECKDCGSTSFSVSLEARSAYASVINGELIHVDISDVDGCGHQFTCSDCKSSNVSFK